jgi:integrase
MGMASIRVSTPERRDRLWLLNAVTTPRVHAFRDELVKTLSRPLAKKVLTTFKMILKDAVRRGALARNVAADVSITMSARERGRLEVGRDIPTMAEITRIIATAEGRGRAFVAIAAFTGLRASELRGLRWTDIDLERSVVHVKQRADRWNKIGRPKSETSERSVPIGPYLMRLLQQWRTNAVGNFVFANGRGNVENLGNLVSRTWWPAQIAAGVIDADRQPKYTGVHSLRHYFASWCINRKADGGRELPLKTVQALLGHSSVTMTADTYSHLFPATDDAAELAAAESAMGLHVVG